MRIDYPIQLKLAYNYKTLLTFAHLSQFIFNKKEAFLVLFVDIITIRIFVSTSIIKLDTIVFRYIKNSMHTILILSILI